MKTVLFDFGGTIDTDGVHWSEKFWEYYQQSGLRVEKREYEAAFVRSDELIMKWADLSSATFYKTLHKQIALQFAYLRLDAEGSMIKTIADDCYQDVRRTIQKASRILEALKKKGLTLGVVSNFYGNLEVVCREFGLDRMLTTMVDSVLVGVRKPDPAIFRIALDACGASPEETVVVGDSYERDIVPAKSLGCTTIWLNGRSWNNPPKSTEAADHTITKFEDLRGILLR
jgi:HAD superfamily hydrolase (TIGR01509 family)